MSGAQQSTTVRLSLVVDVEFEPDRLPDAPARQALAQARATLVRSDVVLSAVGVRYEIDGREVIV
jgi:hypothetical protein